MRILAGFMHRKNHAIATEIRSVSLVELKESPQKNLYNDISTFFIRYASVDVYSRIIRKELFTLEFHLNIVVTINAS